MSAPASKSRKNAASAVVLIVIVLAAVAVFAVLSRPSPGTQSVTVLNPAIGSPIKIGFITEITTGVADLEQARVGITPVPQGYAARIGAELAVNETNAAGGVDGRMIDLIVDDSQSNPQRAAKQALDLDQYGVLAITGPTNQEDALAISDYTGPHEVPFVVSTLSSAALTPPDNNWTVSVQPDAVQWGAAVAKYVSEAVPGAKIALMTQNADQQVEMAAGVKWYASTFKNESIVFDQLYANAQFPWGTAAEAAKFSGANAVIVSWLPTVEFSQSNVIEALQSAGFSQKQIFVASVDDQVSDLGTNATGIRGVTLFDSALSTSYPVASSFVNALEPYIYGDANKSIAYCGVCPTEIGSNYYYSYLGMEMMINAIRNVLSSGQTLTRSTFMSAMKQTSIVDAFGSTLNITGTGASSGTFYVTEVGPLQTNGTTYDLKILESIRFGSGTVPSYTILREF